MKWITGRPAAGSLLASLTGRQGFTVAIAVLFGAGAAALSLAGEQQLATGSVAVLAALLLVGLVQLRRRVGQEIGALRGDIARLTERVVHAQRQLVAAVENERMADADRHEELVQALTAADTRARSVPRQPRTGDREVHGVQDGQP